MVRAARTARESGPKALLALAIMLFAAALPGASPRPAETAEVIIVGDTNVRLVGELVTGIRKTLRHSMKTYTPAEVKGSLDRIVQQEGARVVIVLGRDALAEADRLPEGMPVIYSLFLTPPATKRPNTTGFYMAAPAAEYLDLVRKHIPSIRKIAVLGSPEQLRLLAGDDSSGLNLYAVQNCVQLVDTLRSIADADAILLLPNASLLTAAVMEEVGLVSFKKGIPLLGISERQVNEGALLALVGDVDDLGQSIGELASGILLGKTIHAKPPACPRRFVLFLNRETARKMGIQLPAGFLKTARKVYP